MRKKTVESGGVLHLCSETQQKGCFYQVLCSPAFVPPHRSQISALERRYDDVDVIVSCPQHRAVGVHHTLWSQPEERTTDDVDTRKPLIFDGKMSRFVWESQSSSLNYQALNARQ